MHSAWILVALAFGTAAGCSGAGMMAAPSPPDAIAVDSLLAAPSLQGIRVLNGTSVAFEYNYCIDNRAERDIDGHWERIEIGGWSGCSAVRDVLSVGQAFEFNYPIRADAAPGRYRLSFGFVSNGTRVWATTAPFRIDGQ